MAQELSKDNAKLSATDRAKELYCWTRSFVDPRLTACADLHGVFIFCFPNGGSTAIADLLGSSRHAIGITQNYEGQWAIPTLSLASDRIKDAPLVSSRLWRAMWFRRIHARRTVTPTVLIDKSPDSVFRAAHVIATFGDQPRTVIALYRDPYATCASWMKRYDYRSMATRWGPKFGMPSETRSDCASVVARIWIHRAQRLHAVAESADLVVRYEDICTDVASFIQSVVARVPTLSDIDPAARVSVKDYAPQEIKNMNEKNILALSKEDVRAMQAVFERHADLVTALGYSPILER